MIEFIKFISVYTLVYIIGRLFITYFDITTTPAIYAIGVLAGFLIGSIVYN